MSEHEINELIAHKLNYYLDKTNKTQVDLAHYMNVSQATISNWCKGIKMPRMDKLDKLCHFFNISRSDLMDDGEDSDTYYIDESTAQTAQKIFENKELRLLFDAAQDADPEDIETVHNMLLALKRKERGKID